MYMSLMVAATSTFCFSYISLSSSSYFFIQILWSTLPPFGCTCPSWLQRRQPSAFHTSPSARPATSSSRSCGQLCLLLDVHVPHGCSDVNLLLFIHLPQLVQLLLHPDLVRLHLLLFDLLHVDVRLRPL